MNRRSHRLLGAALVLVCFAVIHCRRTAHIPVAERDEPGLPEALDGFSVLFLRRLPSKHSRFKRARLLSEIRKRGPDLIVLEPPQRCRERERAALALLLRELCGEAPLFILGEDRLDRKTKRMLSDHGVSGLGTEPVDWLWRGERIYLVARRRQEETYAAATPLLALAAETSSAPVQLTIFHCAAS